MAAAEEQEMKKQHAIRENLNQKAPAPVVPEAAATAGQEHGREVATASPVSRAGDERTGTGEAGSTTFSQRQQDEQRADKRAAAIARLNAADHEAVERVMDICENCDCRSRGIYFDFYEKAKDSIARAKAPESWGEDQRSRIGRAMETGRITPHPDDPSFGVVTCLWPETIRRGEGDIPMAMLSAQQHGEMCSILHDLQGVIPEGGAEGTVSQRSGEMTKGYPRES